MSILTQQVTQLKSSFITDDQTNLCLRMIRKIDIFAFIPVPKGDSVSTKQSLVGTAIFFLIFFAYIIFDLAEFITNNPPLIQTFKSPLDDNYYTLPSFAIAFMDNNPYYNVTEYYDDFLSLSWSTKAKTLGKQYSVPIQIVNVTDFNGSQTNFDKLPWISNQTKSFYQIIRTPAQLLKSRGLLFSSDIAVYPSIKLSFCKNSSTKVCKDQTAIQSLANFGRIFLFIEQKKDQSFISRDKSDNNGNNYLQYNFYLLQNLYNRVTINFQVVRTQVLPDYWSRWTKQVTQRLQINTIYSQISKVNTMVDNPDAIAFNLQLSPNIINNRVAFSTLVDHISLWGAFWGVLFAAFALLFLSYNRTKFYKKNPEWDRFKQKPSTKIDNLQTL